MKELDEKVLIDNLDRISYTLDRTYLDELTNSSIVLFEDSNKDGKCLKVEYPSNIRALQVTRWTFDKEQRISDCLKNVLSTFSDGDHTLGVAFHRLCDKTEMYFIIQNVGAAKNEDSERNIDLLEKAIKGNFPGSEIEKCENLFSKDENDDNAEVNLEMSKYVAANDASVQLIRSKNYFGWDKFRYRVSYSILDNSKEINQIEGLIIVRNSKGRIAQRELHYIEDVASQYEKASYRLGDPIIHEWEKYDNIGYIFSRDNGILQKDGDNCTFEFIVTGLYFTDGTFLNAEDLLPAPELRKPSNQ